LTQKLIVLVVGIVTKTILLSTLESGEYFSLLLPKNKKKWSLTQKLNFQKLKKSVI
jgi:hypothetical protein